MIRLAKSKDIAKLVTLYNSSKNLRGEDSKISEYHKENIKEYMKKKKFYVYEETNQILGAMLLEIYSDYIYLHTIIVDKDNRGKGIGTKLMQKLEQLAKDKKITSIEADTEEENIKMQALFKKLGYKRGKNFIFFMKEI